MIKDKIKLYREYGDFDLICTLCSKKNHFSGECEKFHYYPDKDFLIKKYNYTSAQIERKLSNNRNKKKFNALLDNFLIQCSCLKYAGLDEEDSSEGDEDQVNNEINNENEVVENRNKYIRGRKSKYLNFSNSLFIREIKKRSIKKRDSSSDNFEKSITKQISYCDNALFDNNDHEIFVVK